MYKKVDSGMDFVSREREILDFWKENHIFERSIEINKGHARFNFYDGPPTANGKPHIGHVLTRAIKDIIPRYRTMKGYEVDRKAGWDTHGLPVELEVEKSLGMDGKQDIEKYGVVPFIQKCKESVWKYKAEWEEMSDSVGYFADMEHPYVTYEDDYIESEWWSLKEIDKKGLLYHGHKVVPYCPRCGTALSSHEVSQGFRDVTEKSIFVRFKLRNEQGVSFLAWTTTPWTLPSNVALCMNPTVDYARIRVGEEEFILAEALVPILFDDYETVSVKKGKDYEYTQYIPLFDYYTSDKAHYVTVDNYVTVTDGSGIVHIAPAFGEDDSRVGRNYGLPFVQMVDLRGKFVAEAYDLVGIFAKDADKLIVAKLKENGLLFKELMFTHSYPFCWRCDTPLLYYARATWFIKMSALRDKMLKNNATINWIPESIGAGRMGNFLENAIDWGLSRDRYWGTPLPVWVCDKCGKTHVIGSRKELVEMTGCAPDIELHKPFLDPLTFQCECGGTYRRTPEVIDCWYDSGSMPFAQFHYPFENKELFEKNFPADFISEAVDQTRGWFYTLIAISTLLFDSAPFKNCIVLGHVGDKNGIKMSKHKGNVIAPKTVLEKQGADAVRWYFYSASAPWLPSRFSPEAVSDSQRKFIGTFWNTYAFFVLYAEIDGFDPSKVSLKDCALTLMDKWLLSKLNSLIGVVDKYLNDYQITEASRAIEDFTDGLSNWYVRRSRERFWGKDMTDDKKAAYATLYHTIVTLAKLAAPFTPFMTEQIYRNLVTPFFPNEPISIHLASYPVEDTSLENSKLNEEMDFVMELVTLGRACRNKSNIKNRQPLKEVLIKSVGKLPTNLDLLDIARDELNVKTITVITDDADFISYEIKPQLKTLGPKYGKQLGAIRQHLMSADSKQLVATVSNGGTYSFKVGDLDVELTLDDLLISTTSKSGWQAESTPTMTVVLDTELTPELINEGHIREITSKIQNMRKEAGFEVTDHISIALSGDSTLVELAKAAPSLLKDVMADYFSENMEQGYKSELDINGMQLTVTVNKL